MTWDISKESRRELIILEYTHKVPEPSLFQPATRIEIDINKNTACIVFNSGHAGKSAIDAINALKLPFKKNPPPIYHMLLSFIKWSSYKKYIIQNYQENMPKIMPILDPGDRHKLNDAFDGMPIVEEPEPFIAKPPLYSKDKIKNPNKVSFAEKIKVYTLELIIKGEEEEKAEEAVEENINMKRSKIAKQEKRTKKRFCFI